MHSRLRVIGWLLLVVLISELTAIAAKSSPSGIGSTSPATWAAQLSSREREQSTHLSVPLTGSGREVMFNSGFLRYATEHLPCFENICWWVRAVSFCTAFCEKSEFERLCLHHSPLYTLKSVAIQQYTRFFLASITLLELATPSGLSQVFSHNTCFSLVRRASYLQAMFAIVGKAARLGAEKPLKFCIGLAEVALGSTNHTRKPASCTSGQNHSFGVSVVQSCAFLLLSAVCLVR